MHVIDVATGSGDPHYRTFDGRYYTFNGFGEFILMEALSQDGNTPLFTLQGRTGMVSFWRVTTHLALAFGHSQLAFHVSSKFHFLMDNNDVIDISYCVLMYLE